MYNFFKLQNPDAFYKSGEGGKCWIKCFNAMLIMQSLWRRVVDNNSHFFPLTPSLREGGPPKGFPKAGYAAR
jgi:hypothetical protein